MLVGKPGIKADRWIIRFCYDAVGRQLSGEEAHDLVEAAARRLDRPAHHLAHAIWSFARRSRD